MSKEVNDAALRLAIVAHATGLSLADAVSAVSSAWDEYDLGSAEVAPYMPNGMSKPDADGLVAIKAIDELRAKLTAQGQTEAANAINHRWACTPALASLDPKSRAAAIVRINCSTAQLYAGLVGANQVGGNGSICYDVTPNTDPAGPLWRRNTAIVISGGYAVPGHLTTVEQVVEHISTIAYRFRHVAEKQSMAKPHQQ